MPVNPIVSAINIANTGPITEKHPFTAHAHGISEGSFSPRYLIPIGKGIPRKKPMGIRKINVKTKLNGEIIDVMGPVMIGIITLYRRIRNATIIRIKGFCKTVNLKLNKLPIPQPTRRDTRTEATATAGFPKIRMHFWIREISTNINPMPREAKYMRIDFFNFLCLFFFRKIAGKKTRIKLRIRA